MLFFLNITIVWIKHGIMPNFWKVSFTKCLINTCISSKLSFFSSLPLSPLILGYPAPKNTTLTVIISWGSYSRKDKHCFTKKNTGSAQFSFHLSKSLRLHHQRVQVDDEDTAHAATPQRIERYRQQLRWS